ncbi:M1 family metallopeptidase [Massilia psychrophila]|uniref:Aminopeptidase n=1 Tax=Massilia psychrophila TaxID=1603353 RepID=A0A2G8T2T5_9BURK|nr:M1 family metallopeptidase [Massilia psychrophila]PIL40341.1 aminopeptidase [Massilia psychrophila]GGE77843.1 aminopeptidase [Massilia psychrophila]
MHRTLISAAVLALAGLTAAPAFSAPAAPAARAVQATTQLPREVRPIHYDVALTPDAARSTFAGKVAITLDVLAPTASITLNAADLAFISATLASGAGGAPLQASTSIDAAAQTATFTFARPLAKGRYTLALDYTGVIGQQALGLFSLDYDSAAGNQRALYTQFENSDARRMIPSWDEPAYKASFTLQATVPAGQMAVSNMPVTSTSTLPDGRSLVKFGATPKMSTYLLFFGLGDFERVTAMADGTELGVITTRGNAAKAAFALDASKALLGEYNRYFGVRYPLPKLDNIAAPGRSQFFGAMENWGAIFTFEYAILLDPAISTQYDKQEIFATAAHEMAHQWFGNLVTMQWWDDLWLNEGFASWMEGRMTARLHPEWHTALGAVGARERAMARDAFATTHPVVQHVATVEQASQAFDDITYNKGASVIGMLEDYVGAQAWQNGVRAYMREHAYKNTVSDDLWRAIEKAARKPVMAIAHDFTLKPGVPLIRVDGPACKSGSSSTLVVLTQQEFSRDVPNKKPLRWRVPVTLQVAGSNQQVRALVSAGKATVSVPGCGPVIVNAGQNGYYRTLYAPQQFDALSASFASLAPIDQLGLLSDSWALGMAGMQPAAGFMGLANAATLAADPQVWGKIVRIFGTLHGHYAGDSSRQQRFDRFAVARLAPVFNQVGWNARAGENATVANLRAELIGTLSDLNDNATIAEARRRYAGAADDEQLNPPALRKTIMAVIAQHADAQTWDGMHRAAKAEKSPMIKDQLYHLLASAGNDALARRALALAMTDEPGVTNSAAMLAQVAQEHPDMAFDFALAHIDKVNQRVDATSRSRYLPRLASGSADPATIGKLNAYAGANFAAGSRRDADTAIAGIRDRIKTRAERLSEIDAWLSAR